MTAEILGKAKTVRELLKGVKYSIDYYQREYKWQEKQVQELVSDLSDKFLEEYQPDHPRSKVADYPHYFLGSIIISKKDSASFIVDGQQRLTSLTLLLVFLRNLQKGRDTQVNLDELIFSEKFGQKSFNLHVDERTPAMEALYESQPVDTSDRAESVQNLVQRYRDLEACFPEELRDGALPYFVDWLLENVHLVEITAYSDDDAYTIFETMNDRGLSLSPTDMLKGYLLANIDEAKRTHRNRTLARRASGSSTTPERRSNPTASRHGSVASTRPRSVNERRGLNPRTSTGSGQSFIAGCVTPPRPSVSARATTSSVSSIASFDFFSRQYLKVVRATEVPVAGLEHIYYNAQHGFTLQHLLLLTPLKPNDGERLSLTKSCRWLPDTSTFCSRGACGISGRIAYSTMQYSMAQVVFGITGSCCLTRLLPSCTTASYRRGRTRDLRDQRSASLAPAEPICAPPNPCSPYGLRRDEVRPAFALPRLRERGQDPLRGRAHLGRSSRAAH